MGSEIRQQVELLGSEFDADTPQQDITSGRIDDQPFELEAGARRGRLGTPQHASHPSGQLARRERLGDVVIGAELETQHPIGLLPACGEQDDRQGTRPAQLLQDAETVPGWEHHIQDQQIGRIPAGQLQGRVSVGFDLNSEAFAFQIPAHHFANHRLVVDDENGAGGGVPGTHVPRLREERNRREGARPTFLVCSPVCSQCDRSR